MDSTGGYSPTAPRRRCHRHTVEQLRAVKEPVQQASHLRSGNLDVLVVADAGYDTARLAWLLADLPGTLTGRLREPNPVWLRESKPVPDSDGEVDEMEQAKLDAVWDETVSRRLDELQSGRVETVSGRETRAMGGALLAQRRG